MSIDDILNRQPSDHVREEWKKKLEEKEEKNRKENVESVFLFRLSDERYALPVSVVRRVGGVRVVRLLPRARGTSIPGVVNDHGQLVCCVDMHLLFGLPKEPLINGDSRYFGSFPKKPSSSNLLTAKGLHRSPDLAFLEKSLKIPRNTINQRLPKEKSTKCERMVVLAFEKERCVFFADEMLGNYDLTEEEISNIPVTVKKTERNLLKGIFHFKEKTVGLVDEELFFSMLRRKFQ